MRDYEITTQIKLNGPWTQTGVCGNPLQNMGGYSRYQSTASNLYIAFTNGCLAGQGHGAITWDAPIPSNMRSIVKINHYSSTLGQYVESYSRTSTGVTFAPGPRPWIVPHALPAPSPRYLPIKNPAPRPLPVPWKAIPDRVPDPAEEAENPDRPEQEAPEEAPPEWTRIIEYNPAKSPKPTISPLAPPYRRPPRREEKEKKFSGTSDFVQNFFKKISKGKEAISEIDDFIEQIFEALPKEIQKKVKRKTPQGMLKEIYDHWDKIDWYKAIDGIVLNWIEDKVVGTALAASDKTSRMRGATSNIGGRFWINGAR